MPIADDSVDNWNIRFYDKQMQYLNKLNGKEGNG
jgi:hypothetical protein